jgi:pectate lyase
VHVTNLNDSGPGSLRAALSAGDRMVVFDVAGEIRLLSNLRIRGANVTLDGCAAPAPGISLIGYPLEMRGNHGAHDIIVQCIRSRDSIDDGITISEGAYNIVIDRVSVANSGDGAIDIGAWNNQSTHDITVQHSLITQSHKAMLIKYLDVKRITLHHNLITGSSDRNPRIGYNRRGGVPANEITVDLRNNVVANWRGGLGVNVECGAKANIVNNFFTSPASTRSNQQQAIAVYRDNYPQEGCIRAFAYVQGNLSGDVANIDNSPWILVPKEPTPYPAPAITEQDACTAANLVLQQAGHPIRDDIDLEAISGVKGNC